MFEGELSTDTLSLALGHCVPNEIFKILEPWIDEFYDFTQAAEKLRDYEMFGQEPSLEI